MGSFLLGVRGLVCLLSFKIYGVSEEGGVETGLFADAMSDDRNELGDENLGGYIGVDDDGVAVAGRR